MRKLIILDDAPRLCDNPLLSGLSTDDVLVVQLPLGQTRQAVMLRQVRQQFAEQLQRLGFQVVLQPASSAMAIASLASAHDCACIVLNQPVAWDETTWLAALRQSTTLVVQLVDANSLLTDTLAPELGKVPPSYSQFRRAREPELRVSPAVDHAFYSDLHTDLHTAPRKALPLTGEPPSTHAAYAHAPDELVFGPFAGTPLPCDEHSWRQHMQHYIHHSMHQYKQRRNELLGADFASFFSTPLALGLLGVRDLYQHIVSYERLHGENPSSQWLKFELWWREYFRWVFRQEGRQCFLGLGRQPLPTPVPKSQQQLHLRAWQQGRTGVPLVDANMRLLLQTGLMSNRGRQLVASYLVFDLGVDWRLGAAWFEQQLLDYDVASNYGNWAYISGALYSPARWFNQLKQAAEYDKRGDFVAAVLPEICASKPPSMARHQPYIADLGLPFDRRWYEYLQHADAGLV